MKEHNIGEVTQEDRTFSWHLLDPLISKEHLLLPTSIVSALDI